MTNPSAHIGIVTLGVADLARSVRFYEALGLLRKARSSGGDIAFFAAGAVVRAPSQKVLWGGYSAYVADLDDHPWEVAHNPFFALGADGRLTLPD